jgi:parallel beta-helix repeat protein
MKKGIFSVLVGMLMIMSTIVPVSATIVSEKTSQPLRTGNTSYVGGSGPNNYTKIQDAIDNATNDDTVFVFDDSSPYRENIVVDVSLSLVGEAKETTIIDGANISNVVNLSADDVTIMGFTIRNGNNSGIYLTSNNNKISENIITNNLNGIEVHYENLSTAIPPIVGHNTITNNRIINGGIFALSGWNNTVQGNFISQSDGGIIIGGAMNSNISYNTITECFFFGIWVLLSYNTVVYRNNISKNGYGVWTFTTSADKILQNNFFGNNYSAVSYQRILSKIKGFTLEHHLPVRRNVWNGNYWDDPRSLPFIIPGVIMKIVFKVDFGFQIDWHPAQEPYDIPGIR